MSTLLRDPPTDAPYTKLKAELLRLTSVSDRQRYHALVKDETLDDRKPSELLRRMRSLVGNMAIDDKFFKEMFLERLPTSVQTVLASGSDDLDISKLAEMADRMMEVERLPSPTIAQVSQSLTMSTSDLAKLKTQIAQLLAAVADLQLRRSAGPSRRSFGHDRRRSRSRHRTANLCWYRVNYGDEARRCVPSCSFKSMQGNSSAGEALNNITMSDRYPVPHLQDFAGAFCGKTVFSKIDLVRAFHQIPIAAEDTSKTVVTTPFGLFEFLRMPFGLRNASQTFQRFTDRALRGLPFVYAYIDDVLVASRHAEEHLQHLTLPFDRFQQFGVTLHPAKYVLGATSLEFLGHPIDSNGTRPLPSKVAAIQDSPFPTSKRQLQRFLAMLKAATNLENWTDHIPLVLLGIRSALKPDLDRSRAEIVFGVTVRLPGEMISPTPRGAVEDPTNLLHRLRQFMRTLSPVPPGSSASSSYHEKDLAKCSHVYLRCD
ncbi:hypothetical protein SprV_0401595200 [Sparganum proliferum]